MIILVALAVFVAVALAAADVIDKRTKLHPPGWPFFFAYMGSGLLAYWLTLGIFAMMGFS